MLKAVHYKTAMQYIDQYAPIVARTQVFIRGRETMWRVIAQKAGDVPRMPLRQMFMTYWALLRKGYLGDADMLKKVLESKYPHYPAEWVTKFVEAAYGEVAGGQ
jgi:hypothetical protein